MAARHMALLSPLLLFSQLVDADTQMWRGRLTYPGCSTNVPLDIKVCTADCGASCPTPPCAAANWTFQNCDGGHCGQGSAGGHITIGGAGRTANNWTAQGGWGPPVGPGSHGGAFYSLTGLLSADKTQLTNGEIYRGAPDSTWVSDGTWHATKGAPPDTNFTCVPPAPLPWASCEALPKSWKPPNATNTTRPLIWPLPKFYTTGSTVLRVVPSVGFFDLTSGSSALLTAAFQRYADLTFPHPSAPSSDDAATRVSSLKLTVVSLAEDFPQLGDNESYALTVSASGEASLTAATVWGALHGLETFSQVRPCCTLNFPLRVAPAWLVG